MGGGAVQLLQFQVFVKEEGANVVRARRRKCDEDGCRSAPQSSRVSFSGPAAVPRLHLRSGRHFSADAKPTCARSNLLAGGSRICEGSARQCSESGVAETAQESAVSNDASEVAADVVGDSFGSNGQAILTPGRQNDEYIGEATALLEEDDLSAAARIDRIEQNRQLLVQDRENYAEDLREKSAEQQNELSQGVPIAENKSMLDQIRDILVFAGPALGIWLSGPLMSIIDTAVIGNSSSLELAALGPGTVLCDQTCYVFMFLSIATSNLIATSLANKDEKEAAGHLSRLLFVALFCGVGMLVITGCFATPLLKAFVGPNNYSLIPVARLYVQIRALAWPVVLMGMVAQSASLGMQDSWAPLKVLAVASSVNLFGDILLCTVLGHGMGGAAWATTISQYVGVFLMMKSLGDKGYNPLAISVPSFAELINMINLAGPILLTMLSKSCFYIVITFLATSLGPITLASHQVMIGIFSLCTVWGEPLAQTAQSFMPAFMYGSNRNLKKARALLHSLLVIGAFVGVGLAAAASSVPWLCPQIFTSDAAIVNQMRSLGFPFFFSIMLTPPTLCCEGTLMAGRDLKFVGLNMASCFCGGTIMLVTLNRLGGGLNGSWWTLVVFQLTRFILAYMRLSGSKSVLADQSRSSEREASLQFT